MKGRAPAGRRCLRLAAAALCAGLLLPAGAMAWTPSDPLAVSAQDWLGRVIPPGLAPPSRPTPPVAIIETGVDLTHPDIAGSGVMVRRISPPPPAGDVRAGADFAEGVAHGTAVASIIGAPRNGVGIEGVLPGSAVWVYGTSGTCSDTAAAIRQAVRDGARVINASYIFSSGGACRDHHDATSFAFGKRVLVVAAAGNDRAGRAVQPGNDLHVLTVGALTPFTQPAYFSRQNTHLDLMAPGEGVLAAIPVSLDTTDGAQDGYSRLDGTSFATPIVAAAAAWVMAERPRLSADQVAQILRESAADLGRRGWDRAYGWGRLDIAAALRRRAGRTDPLEPNDDIRWVSGRAGVRAAVPFLRRGRSARIAARLDIVKDPYDVYPIWLPPGSRLTAELRPLAVGADLYLWQPGTRSAIGSAGVVSFSRKPGRKVDRVTATNGTRRRLVGYVEVRGVRGPILGGSYRLTLRRTR